VRREPLPGRAVTRYREDATRDLGSQFIYLRDVRSGMVWSATHHPIARESEDYLVTLQAEKVIFHRRDDDIVTQLEIAVSNEDDVEVRRLSVTNQSDRARELEITSYAEIVLAMPAEDLSHPPSASSSSKPNTWRTAPHWSVTAGHAPGKTSGSGRCTCWGRWADAGSGGVGD